jgi:hypothetical protein
MENNEEFQLHKKYRHVIVYQPVKYKRAYLLCPEVTKCFYTRITYHHTPAPSPQPLLSL